MQFWTAVSENYTPSLTRPLAAKPGGQVPCQTSAPLCLALG